ncbi:MAG: PaaI family thioesterase [Elusimicrobia bacterium]|nr:PaaI family thioesterase [Candidatus Obscuribacterium magneticum]
MTPTQVLELTDDAHCFVCGHANVSGLQLTWHTEGNHTKAEFYPSRTHQGWRGLVHGGILASLLDEAMTRLAWESQGPAVSAELNIRYFNPARTGEKLTVTGEIAQVKGKLILGKAEIRNGQRRLIATATGKVLKVEANP